MRRLCSPYFLSVAVVILTLAVPNQYTAQVANHPRVREALGLLDIWMEAQQAYERIPGASLAVVHDQELVWAKGYGYAHMEEEIPATPETMYSICSISKLFTAISVMQLRDQNQLRLTDPISKHLDWFSLQQTYPEAGPVTIEGVLTHSSGLPREADAPYWTGPNYPFPTHEQIVERLSNQEMLYPARTYYQYSNLGLTLAGEVLMALTGQPWGDYVKRYILDPLEMTNTTTEHIDKVRDGALATGYSPIQRHGGREVIPPYEVRGIGPAAGMLSTVEDLAKFAMWQFRTLSGQDNEILHRNTLREMQRVHFMEPDAGSTYGLGFSVSQSNGQTFVGHGGSCPGYESNLRMRPQDKIATTFMTNGRRVSASNYAQRVFDIVAPAIRAAIRNPNAEYEAKSDLKTFTGIYSRPFGTESAVLIWEGELVTFGLPSNNPLNGMTRLKRINGNSFQRIRSDGNLGEEFLFEQDADGKMLMWRNNNYSVRTHAR